MRFWHGGADHLAGSGEIITLNPGAVHDGWTDAAVGCRYHMLYVEIGTIEELFAADDLRIGQGWALAGPVLRDPALAGWIGRFVGARGDALHACASASASRCAWPISRRRRASALSTFCARSGGRPACRRAPI